MVIPDVDAERRLVPLAFPGRHMLQKARVVFPSRIDGNVSAMFLLCSTIKDMPFDARGDARRSVEFELDHPHPLPR